MTVQPKRVLSILVVSAVLIWIDTTVLGIALERLADPIHGLGASPGQLQWTIGAYSLLFATALFAAGALGDRYGHRTVLLAGLATFGVASAWAAWAANPASLIVARSLMGVGGAMIMPTSMAIITWVFPPEQRPGAIAAWSASSGVGVAAGPLLGGLLIDHFWWGSVFLINLPIVVLAMLGVVALVPNPHSPQARRLDPVGIALSTGGLLGLAYGLIEGGQGNDWTRWQVCGPLLAGLALIAVFLVAELRSAQPSFDPRLFRNKRFAAGNAALAAVFLAITGQAFYGTFYLQGARGMTALEAGLTGLPAALGVVVGSPLGARLARRFGVAATAGPAMLAMAAMFGLNSTFTVTTPLLWFCTVGAVVGLSIGLAVAPTTAAVITALPLARMGAGSAVNNTLRQVGSVIGVAVLGTVLANAYQRGIAASLTGLPSGVADAARPSAEATRRVAAAIGQPDLVDAANRSFIHAMHVTATAAGAVVLLGALVLLTFLRTAPATPTQTQPEPAVPAAA